MPIVRLSKTLTPLLALTTLTGCTMFGSNTHKYQAPTPVQAYNVTHLPEPESHYTLAYPTGDRRTSQLLIEQTSPGEVRVGRECSYQLKITNLTTEPVRNIVLRSRPLEGMRITASSATTRPIGDGQIVYDIGDLGPHEYTAVDVRALPDQLGKIESSYVVSAQPPVLHTALNVVQPILKVAASGPSDIDICQEIIYRYTVTNAGTGTARDVMIQAALPDGLTTADGRGIISAALGDIPENQSRDITAHLHASRTGRFTTQAVARSRDDGTARADALVTAAHAPALAIAVRGPDQVYAGKPAVYSITITNTGDAPARQTGLKLNTSEIGQLVSLRTDTDNGPGEPQLASAVLDISNNSLGTLRPGESRHIEVTTQALDGGTLTLDATASTPCANDARQSARTRVLTVPALLLQASDEVDPVPVGQDVTYDVAVTNGGTGTDTNIRLTATLPDNMVFVRATGATDVHFAGHTLTFSPVPRLAPKEAAAWKITARALRPGDTQFKLSATSDALKTPTQKTEPTRLY